MSDLVTCRHGTVVGGKLATTCKRCIAETGTPYVPDGWSGEITGCSDCGNDAPDEICRRHDQPTGPLCQPCRLGQLMVHLFCWKCGGNQFLWNRTGITEWARIESFGNDDVPVINDSSWDSDSTGDGDTWVSCRSCGTVLMRDVDYATA